MDDQRRADEDAIIRMKHLYGAVIDGIVAGDHAVDDLEQVLAPDAVIQSPPVVDLKGMAAIKAFFGETMPVACSSMWHSFSNPIIDVEGDQARGRWLVLAYTRRPGDAAPSVTHGRYTDRYVRTARGWRIIESVIHRM